MLHVAGGPGGSGKAVGLRAERMRRPVVLEVSRDGGNGSKVICSMKDKVCLSSQKRIVLISVGGSNLKRRYLRLDEGSFTFIVVTTSCAGQTLD